MRAAVSPSTVYWTRSVSGSFHAAFASLQRSGGFHASAFVTSSRVTRQTASSPSQPLEQKSAVTSY